MVTINAYNGVSQSLFTKFVKTIDIERDLEFSIVGVNNIYTIDPSVYAYLPASQFYSIFPGAIITANNQSRYLLSKIDPDNPVTLNSSVDWNNDGLGYSFTYKNPISQIIDENQNITGYITADNKIYITGESSEVNTDQVMSTSNGLKLLNSNGYGIYITSGGLVYKGDSTTDTWENIGGLSSEDLSNFVSKTDTDVSGNSWVLDEDLMTSDSDEKLATQQSVKSFVDDKSIDGGSF